MFTVPPKTPGYKVLRPTHAHLPLFHPLTPSSQSGQSRVFPFLEGARVLFELGHRKQDGGSCFISKAHHADYRILNKSPAESDLL